MYWFLFSGLFIIEMKGEFLAGNDVVDEELFLLGNERRDVDAGIGGLRVLGRGA